MSMFRNLLTKTEQPTQPDYIKDGLQVYYSGLNNTGSGHSNTATYWEDLTGNGNDGLMYKFSDGSGENSGWTTNGLRFRLNQANCGIVTINDRNMDDLFSQMPFTISCTYTVRQKGTYMGLFGNHGVGNDGFICQYEGTYSGIGWLGGNGRSISSSIWANNGSQHNLTMVFMSTSRIILYVDGQQQYDRTAFDGTLNEEMIFSIGNAFLQTNPPEYANNNRAFDGVIHNFLLYDRQLTLDEIRYNYSIDVAKYFS